jgi:hypothetical protein
VLAQQLATQPTAAASSSLLEQQQDESVRPAPGGGKGTLTIVDNRTGKKYTVRRPHPPSSRARCRVRARGRRPVKAEREGCFARAARARRRFRLVAGTTDDHRRLARFSSLSCLSLPNQQTTGGDLRGRHHPGLGPEKDHRRWRRRRPALLRQRVSRLLSFVSFSLPSRRRRRRPTTKKNTLAQNTRRKTNPTQNDRRNAPDTARHTPVLTTLIKTQ